MSIRCTYVKIKPEIHARALVWQFICTLIVARCAIFVFVLQLNWVGGVMKQM